MGQQRVQEAEFVVTLPAYFLVRVPEVHDATDVARNTLRLAAMGKDSGRRWFVPVYSSEESAQTFATQVKKIDDKLRVFAVHTVKDWASVLDVLLASGDKLTAFDPQSTHVEHIAIDALLAGARRHLTGTDSAAPARSREQGSTRGWFRGRSAAQRSEVPAAEARSQAATEIAVHEVETAAPAETDTQQSLATSRLSQFRRT